MRKKNTCWTATETAFGRISSRYLINLTRPRCPTSHVFWVLPSFFVLYPTDSSVTHVKLVPSKLRVGDHGGFARDDGGGSTCFLGGSRRVRQPICFREDNTSSKHQRRLRCNHTHSGGNAQQVHHERYRCERREAPSACVSSRRLSGCIRLLIVCFWFDSPGHMQRALILLGRISSHQVSQSAPTGFLFRVFEARR